MTIFKLAVTGLALATITITGVHADELSPAIVVITATRSPQSSFDIPAAIDIINKNEIQDQQARISISETLSRVPGIQVLNRETLAQEQQITVRGFGARSQFGVRGIKLLADGIPASTPDGQGGTGLFDLASAQRIEVLRGPFSALYGNHSGGVVQIFTEDGPLNPSVSADYSTGSYGSRRGGLKAGGQFGALNVLLSTSQMNTDGYRDWSSAQKSQLNAKLRYTANEDTTVTILGNSLDQTENLDPLGLTAAQVAQSARQANPAALTFKTRRNLDNLQVGLVFDHSLGGSDTLHALTYSGTRSNEQYLAFTGVGATSSGGVSTYEREIWGAGLRWSRQTGKGSISAGLEYDRADDKRLGYVNNFGVKGALRRDEANTVGQSGIYTQAEWVLAPQWSLHGGLRYSRVSFDSRDHYIVDANPDDSGSIDYSAWTPVAGLLYRLNENVNLYANLGRSFETPTFIELAYRNTGSGLNLQLAPSKSNHGEIGIKALLGSHTRLTAAAFQIETLDEIVVDTNIGGRTTYRNAGKTQRRGIELGMKTTFDAGFNVSLSATWLDARFSEAFIGSTGLVAVGNWLPGLPRHSAAAELSWSAPEIGFSAGLEGRWNGTVQVDDVNSESANSYFVTNLRSGFKQDKGNWRFEEFLRIDNIGNRSYVGTVYVNDGNGRYYAPSALRSYMLGISAIHRF